MRLPTRKYVAINIVDQLSENGMKPVSRSDLVREMIKEMKVLNEKQVRNRISNDISRGYYNAIQSRDCKVSYVFFPNSFAESRSVRLIRDYEKEYDARKEEKALLKAIPRAERPPKEPTKEELDNKQLIAIQHQVNAYIASRIERGVVIDEYP